MNKTILAYLAGAMDSDGSFGIKRSTYHMRVRGDAWQPVYQERADLKQAAPDIPNLLRQTFGGSLSHNAPGTAKSKPLYGWHASDRVAANTAKALLPYLRIKRRQAELLIELRATKDDSRYQQFAYWWGLENPKWRKMPMLTYNEAARVIGYKSRTMVSQAVRNGSLLALPYDYTGRE
ncbi:MAG: hypothetical protein JOY71_10115, partial [Acetobacteraceae bacterium]|nr:hypothetical protein [Acetobacteraceae bacterium]